MKVALIGWPSADGRNNETIGRATAAPSHGGGGMSSVVFRDYTTGNLGDITGTGAGRRRGR
jgi:hypothetical protein